MKCNVLICWLLLLSSASVLAVPEWLDEHARKVRHQAINHNIPGYALVYVEKGQTPQVFTYGKTQSKGPEVTSQTVFRLASVSKTFTAALMAKLVEKEELHWDTSLASLAPQFEQEAARFERLNLGHLLSQSSGYSPNAYDNLIEADYSLKRVLNELAELQPLCAPGKCYTYQNALFGVLENYFQQQSTTYGQQLRQEIFDPLNMPYASAGKQALVKSDNWAKPHIAITKKKWRRGQVEDNYYRFSPAAGVNASIEDMTIWLQAMLGEYPQQLGPHLVAKLTEPHIQTKRELRRRAWRQYLQDAHYGLGWRVYNFEGNKLNYHGGWVKGYRADVAFAPDRGVGYAMLMNAESNLINSFTAEFWQRYFSANPLSITPVLVNKLGDSP